VLLQVAPTDRIRDTTQKTDVRRPKHPCTFLRVLVRRIWVEACLEICLRPAGSNEARLIASDVKSVLPYCTATQTFCGKRASEPGLACQSSTTTSSKSSFLPTALACWPDEDQLAFIASFPQHSGRSGRPALSHPPPNAWINWTAATIRRPRMFTAVASSERAALCATVTSR